MLRIEGIGDCVLETAEDCSHSPWKLLREEQLGAATRYTSVEQQPAWRTL